MNEPTPDRRAPGKLMGRLAVLGAALLWSTSGLFAKSPIFLDWPVELRGPMLAFWRAVFASLILMPTIRRPRWRGLLVPLVLCFAAMNVTYLTAMTRTTAANAIWLQSTAPWWVFLLSVFLFHEPVARRDLVPLVFGVLGVGTILGFELANSQGIARSGALLGLASGGFYAGVVVLMRQLRTENSPWLVALNHAVAAVTLLPWVLWFGRWPSPTQLLVVAGFGIFQMALPYLLLIRGLRVVTSVEAMGIGLIEPVVIPFWVFLAWGERPDWWTMLGAAMILTGLFLRYILAELWLAKNGRALR
jgi:drug/metabolite transporter (DMT)-like permease